MIWPGWMCHQRPLLTLTFLQSICAPALGVSFRNAVGQLPRCLGIKLGAVIVILCYCGGDHLRIKLPVITRAE